MHAPCDCVNMIVSCTHDCVRVCVCARTLAACQASLLPRVNKTCPSVASQLRCLSLSANAASCFSALMTEEGKMRRKKTLFIQHIIQVMETLRTSPVSTEGGFNKVPWELALQGVD